MIIDVSQIVGKPGRSIDFSKDMTIENTVCYPDVVDFLKPVKIEGKITNTEGILGMNAKGTTRVTMQCSRCLSPVEVDVEFYLNENFKATGDISEEDFIGFSGDEIDITEIVMDAVHIATPMKVVCDDDCKGLCPSCGKNLNEGDCGCDNTYINPKFASLRSLFKDDEEV